MTDLLWDLFGIVCLSFIFVNGVVLAAKKLGWIEKKNDNG